MARLSRFVVPDYPHHVTQRGVRGYLVQGRFGSCILDQQHLLATGRYIENKAGMVPKATDYPWSSARYQCGLIDSNPLLRERPPASIVDDWLQFLRDGETEQEAVLLEKTRTGRPAGSDDFIRELERQTGRSLLPGRPGRPRKRKK
ncbi:hypothetical protein C2E25_17080 [Geothermobacter hydrogeniphilus]|uniref:Transposase n=1 Tax=Geothermobacter hydrogeniphilus TaxID=1969733 RepID=A0A2K2H5P1_9BACT|nr:hypothetical protein [Geothermobacter hydrogeniphilus]PNU18559.1 hypothetical protein C2E25_17080 [Geothermobacter hydrogeniphilus]